MRSLFALLLLPALTACGKDFDERYAETSERVKAKEVRIDKARDKAAKKEAGEQ